MKRRVQTLKIELMNGATGMPRVIQIIAVGMRNRGERRDASEAKNANGEEK